MNERRSTKGDVPVVEDTTISHEDLPCEKTVEKRKIPHSEAAPTVSVTNIEVVSDNEEKKQKIKYKLIDDKIKENILRPLVLLTCGFLFFNWGILMLVNNDMAIVLAWIFTILGAATIVFSVVFFVIFLCIDDWFFDRKNDILAKTCGTIAMCVACAIGIVLCIVICRN